MLLRLCGLKSNLQQVFYLLVAVLLRFLQQAFQYRPSLNKAVRPCLAFCVFFLIEKFPLSVLQLPDFFFRFCNLFFNVCHVKNLLSDFGHKKSRKSVSGFPARWCYCKGSGYSVICSFGFSIM